MDKDTLKATLKTFLAKEWGLLETSVANLLHLSITQVDHPALADALGKALDPEQDYSVVHNSVIDLANQNVTGVTAKEPVLANQYASPIVTDPMQPVVLPGAGEPTGESVDVDADADKAAEKDPDAQAEAPADSGTEQAPAAK